MASSGCYPLPMRFIATLALGLMVAPGYSQNAPSAEAIIDSRQAEVASLGQMLYGIDVHRGTWVHHEAAICPPFTHHAFARYDRTDGDHAASSFIAIYSLDTPPAPSLKKPWQGGIVLLPLVEYHAGTPIPAIERATTILIFNHVWQDELKKSSHPSQFPGLSWAGLADCFIAFANEQPKPFDEIQDSRGKEASIDLKGQPISNILVPLVARGPNSRAVSIGFDTHGLISSSSVSEGAKVKPITSPNVPQPKQTTPPPHHPA